MIPGVIAMEVWGDTYEQSLAQGNSEDQAASFANTQAILQEASERVGSAVLGKIFKAGGKLLWKTGKAALSEGLQELSQEGLAVIAEKVYGIEPDSPMMQRFKDAFFIGGLTGGGAVNVVTGLQKARQAVKQQNKSDMKDAVAEGDVRKVKKLENEREQIGKEELKEQQDAEQEVIKAQEDAVKEQEKAQAEQEKEISDAEKATERVAEASKEDGDIKAKPEKVEAKKEEVKAFETGKPTTFEYMRNPEKAPKAKGFQQDIEPQGRYLSEKTKTVPEGWEQGTISFKNPLVVEFNTGEGIYDERSWKARLSKEYGNKKGASLSRAIASEGYDGIVTIDRGFASEIVDLSRFTQEPKKPAIELEPLVKPTPKPKEDIKTDFTTMSGVIKETIEQGAMKPRDIKRAVTIAGQKEGLSGTRINTELNKLLKLNETQVQKPAEPKKPEAKPATSPEIERATEQLKSSLGIDEQTIKDIPKVMPLLESRAELTVSMEALKKSFFRPRKKTESVKGRIQRTTGLKDISKKLTISESKLLKEQIKSQVRAGKEISKQLTKEIKGSVLEEFAAIEAMRKQVLDYAKATGIEKNSPISNIILKTKTLRGMEKAIEQIDKKVLNFKEKERVKISSGKLKKTLKELKGVKLRPEFDRKIQELTNNLESSKLSDRKRKVALNMKSFLERNPDHVIPEKQLRLLDRLDKKAIGDLSADEIELLSDSLKHVVHLNKLKNNLIMKGKYVDAKKIRTEATSNLNRYQGKLEYKVDEISPFEEEKKGGTLKRIFTTGSWNPELISEIMDKEEHGVIKRIIYDGIDTGYTEKYKFEQEAEDYFKAEFEKIGFNEKKLKEWSKVGRDLKASKKVPVESFKLESGKTLKLTKGQKVAVYLHSLNKKNKAHLINGGLSFPEKTSAIAKITEKDISEIVGSMSEEEFKMAESFSKYYENQKDAINKISVELNGWEIAKEPNYFPIRTNALDRIVDQLKQVKGAADIKTFMNITLEGQGIFKQRTGARGALILDDVFEATYKSNKQTAAYIGLANPIRNAKMLLYDNDFQKKALQTYGKDYVDALKSYLRDIESSSHDIEITDDLIQKANNNVTVAILGLNPWVMMKQVPSYFLAFTEMDIKYVGNLKPASKELMSKYSPQLRERFKGNVTRDMGELNQRSNARLFFGGKPDLSNTLFMGGISRFDYEAVGRIWSAAEKEISDTTSLTKGSDEFYNKVARRAEEVTRKTQPTFEMKDRSEIARSKQFFVKFATKFSSARNKIYMTYRRVVEKYNRSNKTVTDKATLLKNMTLISVVSAGLITALDKARDMLRGNKRKKKDVGNLYQSFAKGYDIQDPITQSVNNGVDALKLSYKAIDQLVTGEEYKVSNRRWGTKKGEKKFKNSAIRAAKKDLEILGLFKGLPLRNIMRSSEQLKSLNDKVQNFMRDIDEKPSSTGRKKRGSRRRGR